MLSLGATLPQADAFSLAQKWSPTFAPTTPKLNISLVLRPDTWTSTLQLEDYIEPEELLNATQIVMTFIADYWNNQRWALGGMSVRGDGEHGEGVGTS